LIFIGVKIQKIYKMTKLFFIFISLIFNVLRFLIEKGGFKSAFFSEILEA